MSEFDDTSDLTESEVRQLLRIVAGERDALRRTVTALRADAERYRWLCDNRLHSVSHPNGDAWGMSEVIYGDDLDAAIDRARGES